jgi:hypothetical protein
VLTGWEAQADASRRAAGHLRRVGNLDALSYALGNLATALLNLGDWDGADAELTQAIASGELAENWQTTLHTAELAALRGDTAAAEALLATLRDLPVSEKPQSQAFLSQVEASLAAARGEAEVALRHARNSFAHLGSLGFDFMVWTWALALRAAFELADHAAVRELLAMLDSRPPGHVPRMLRPEGNLARARLAAAGGDPAAGPLFASAISGLRELSTPYHLAHGLLDHAAYLTGLGDTTAAAMAAEEAQDIGQRLRCQPLLDRAAALAPAQRVRA